MFSKQGGFPLIIVVSADRGPVALAFTVVFERSSKITLFFLCFINTFVKNVVKLMLF